MAAQNVVSGAGGTALGCVVVAVCMADGIRVQRTARTVPRRAKLLGRLGVGATVVLSLGVVLPWLNVQEQTDPNTWPLVLAAAPVRFSIVAALADVDEAEFGHVRDAVETSDSVLSKQSTQLEAAGYVRIRKGYVGKRPRTWLSLTSAGRDAYARHLEALRTIAGGACGIDPGAGAPYQVRARRLPSRHAGAAARRSRPRRGGGRLRCARRAPPGPGHPVGHRRGDRRRSRPR